METPSRSFGPSGRGRCAGPTAFRPMRVRAHPATRREMSPGVTARWDSPLESKAEPQTRRLLLVGLDPETCGMLRFCLSHEGYRDVEAVNDFEAIEAALHSQPTAIILDVDMQEADGFVVLQKLRENTRAHVIVLSRIQDESRKLQALDGGANDYLLRPFSMAELAARLRAAARFSPAPAKHVFQLGQLSVDPASHIVKVGGRSVRLTATEFSLLMLFVRNAGKVLTHAQILKEIWGPKMLSRLEYLRVYLKSLRGKLENNPDKPELLLTIRSVGYRLATAE
jgi:two-component system KDP operon response regulator KdpE